MRAHYSFICERCWIAEVIPYPLTQPVHWCCFGMTGHVKVYITKKLSFCDFVLVVLPLQPEWKQAFTSVLDFTTVLIIYQYRSLKTGSLYIRRCCNILKRGKFQEKKKNIDFCAPGFYFSSSADQKASSKANTCMNTAVSTPILTAGINGMELWGRHCLHMKRTLKHSKTPHRLAN